MSNVWQDSDRYLLAVMFIGIVVLILVSAKPDCILCSKFISPFSLFSPVYVPNFGESLIYSTILTGSTFKSTKPQNTEYYAPHVGESPICLATFSASTGPGCSIILGVCG